MAHQGRDRSHCPKHVVEGDAQNDVYFGYSGGGDSLTLVRAREDAIVVIRRTRGVVFTWIAVSAVALFMIWVVVFPPETATFWYLFQGLLAVC
jgi:hypothetical protein